MEDNSILHKPYWLDSIQRENYTSLEGDIETDVAIVGCGITGITCAYLLANEGMKVTILEKNKVLNGISGHTTAKITSQHSLIYDTLINKFGIDRAKEYAEANENAIKLIKKIIDDNKIDCDFKEQSAYIYTQEDNYIKQIQDEAKAASKLGIKADYLDEINLPIKVKAALRFDSQAAFHPGKYLNAIIKQLTANGVKIYEDTKAIDIETGDKPKVITEKHYKVTAKYIILASHYPFFDGKGLYFARMYADCSYILALKLKEDFPEGMYITAEDPVRSLRTTPYEKNGEKFELVILSGEDHKTGHDKDTEKHYLNLKQFASERLNVDKFLYKWFAQDYITVDNVPYIGHLTKDTPNIYVATGFKKWGMTNSNAAALIITDMITKGESKWQHVFDPSRFVPSAALLNAVTQNLDVAKYYILGKVESLPAEAKISTGEASTVKIDGDRKGAYRDENGELHILDTTCTHLGCELNWNSAEKTWDCPCHGSRFTYDGKVIDGPALNNLKHLDEGKNKVEPNIL